MRVEGYTRIAVRLHIISHTHWDREWFVPSEFTREWLPPFFDALLERFAAEESYRFVLDGQSILLEDYLLQLEETEQERAARRISELATSRRLVLGPYYQQPDWQLAGEESLLRNLLIGTGDAAAFGEVSRCGWLMDNFGQIAQAVQIHNGFGIAAVFAWRGFDLLPDRLRDLIIWESPDGSRLPVVYLIDSYRNGMRLFSHETFLERRLLACLDRLAPFS